MTTIRLKRERVTGDATIGRLFIGEDNYATLEDVWRKFKVAGETRIPAGKYPLQLRTEGSKTKRYAERFPDMHKGMLWLQDVPDFTYVYIHIGNRAEDTEGCILVGMRAGEDVIYSSRAAYEEIYPRIVEMIEKGGCTLEIEDEQ